MEKMGVVDFDLSSGEAPSYFKSSFARSMACEATGSRSLDYSTLESTVTPGGGSRLGNSPVITGTRRPRRSVPTLPTFESPPVTSSSPAGFLQRTASLRSNEPLKFWRMKQETAGKTGEQSEDRAWLTGDSAIREETREQEILRLRKECQSLMETNRKLETSRGPGVCLDEGLLQAQIDTLQWQLKQAESNREMYRVVMEQVSKFLERLHTSLESGAGSTSWSSSGRTPGGSPVKSHSSRTKARTSRSRSVHTVAGGSSRGSSPSSSVHRANSISQIQDTSSYSAFRDHASWSGSVRLRREEEASSPERLAGDAFRLLRTVQSLLATREPDLARLSESHSSPSMEVVGSCSSLPGCKEVEEKASTPQPSVGSTEDESGFSSMSSFHEVVSSGGGGGGGSHHELGLPLVALGGGSHHHSHRQHQHQQPQHHQHQRRWSSATAPPAAPVVTTPVPPPPQALEPLRVLWV